MAENKETEKDKESTNFHVRFSEELAKWLRKEAKKQKFESVPAYLKNLVRQQMIEKAKPSTPIATS